MRKTSFLFSANLVKLAFNFLIDHFSEITVLNSVINILIIFSFVCINVAVSIINSAYFTISFINFLLFFLNRHARQFA